MRIIFFFHVMIIWRPSLVTACRQARLIALASESIRETRLDLLRPGPATLVVYLNEGAHWYLRWPIQKLDFFLVLSSLNQFSQNKQWVSASLYHISDSCTLSNDIDCTLCPRSYMENCSTLQSLRHLLPRMIDSLILSSFQML